MSAQQFFGTAQQNVALLAEDNGFGGTGFGQPPALVTYGQMSPPLVSGRIVTEFLSSPLDSGNRTLYQLIMHGDYPQSLFDRIGVLNLTLVLQASSATNYTNFSGITSWQWDINVPYIELRLFPGNSYQLQILP